MPAVRLGLRMRLALACAFLSASISILGVLMSMLVVDSSIEAALQFAPGQIIQVTIPGHIEGQAEGTDVVNAVRKNAAETLLLRGLLISAFSALLGGGAGYIIAARALGPVAEVTAAARRISAGAMLKERIALSGAHDELRDLADTFDAMLERLDRSFDAQRRFVANASHELRTPLSIMRTEVEVTLADPDASVTELREMSAVVLGAIERANNLVEALLVLAKVEAQIEQGLNEVTEYDLADALPLAISAMAQKATARGVTIEQDIGPALVVGDPRLLDQLVGNLVQNAVNHNIDGGMIWIELATRDDMAVLTISNTGQVLDAHITEELFAPFRRAANRTSSEGTGLGLSIVNAIVMAHRGRVVARARAEGGLDVIAQLPLADADRLERG